MPISIDRLEVLAAQATRAEPVGGPRPGSAPGSFPDITTVITNALKAAGLMKATRAIVGRRPGQSWRVTVIDGAARHCAAENQVISASYSITVSASYSITVSNLKLFFETKSRR
jgi:hypothetical protein